MSFSVYKYDHPEFGPVMLLLDDEEPEDDQPKRRNDQLSENKRRGHSYKPPIPNQKKNSIERTHQQSLQRKKSVQNGVILPNIANKRSHIK